MKSLKAHSNFASGVSGVKIERIDFTECPLTIYGRRWRWPSLRPEGHTEEREGEYRQGQTAWAKPIVTGARPSWELFINSAVNGPAEGLNH
jgi:hypothetical protein